MIDDGFNLVYAKRNGSPKNIFFRTKRELIEFILINLDNMELIFVNDRMLDKNKLVNDNVKLSRYLKIKKIKSIYDL